VGPKWEKGGRLSTTDACFEGGIFKKTLSVERCPIYCGSGKKLWGGNPDSLPVQRPREMGEENV